MTTIGATTLDAVFTITNTSIGAQSNRIYFTTTGQDNIDRKDRVRLRFDNQGPNSVTRPMWAEVAVAFYQAGTTDVFNGFGSQENPIEILTQFDDLDSDLERDYSDFAGIRNNGSDFDSWFLPAGGSSNLEGIVFDGIGTGPGTRTTSEDYLIGILKKINGSWNDQINAVGDDPVIQAPYTIAFAKELTGGAYNFSFIMGNDGSGQPNRHVDMDMSGILIPEPGALALMAIALGSAGGWTLLKRRKRA